MSIDRTDMPIINGSTNDSYHDYPLYAGLGIGFGLLLIILILIIIKIR